MIIDDGDCEDTNMCSHPCVVMKLISIVLFCNVSPFLMDF
jgi:hypothetical protein